MCGIADSQHGRDGAVEHAVRFREDPCFRARAAAAVRGGVRLGRHEDERCRRREAEVGQRGVLVRDAELLVRERGQDLQEAVGVVAVVAVGVEPLAHVRAEE